MSKEPIREQDVHFDKRIIALSHAIAELQARHMAHRDIIAGFVKLMPTQAAEINKTYAALVKKHRKLRTPPPEGKEWD